MAFNWVTIVRGVQILFSLVVLGTAGYLVHLVPGFDEAAFNVFTAVWTILVCAFFIVTGLFMSDGIASNAIITLALDGLTWIFWLSAFACFAAKLEPINDIVPPGYTTTPLNNLRAAVAFGVMNWLLFTATLIWNAMSGFRGKSAGGAPAHQGV